MDPKTGALIFNRKTSYNVIKLTDRVNDLEKELEELKKTNKLQLQVNETLITKITELTNLMNKGGEKHNE